jgi:DNA gyrase subunit A
VACVRDDDELLMMTARGKLQRIVAGEISVIGRNTQGVRIMSLDEGDTLAAVVRVPREDNGEPGGTSAPEAPPPSAEAESPESSEPPQPEEPDATPDTGPIDQ